MGEAEFGLLDGVISTRAGFLGTAEVVEVGFDPAVLGFAELLAHAQKSSCADRVWTTTAAQAKAAEQRFKDRTAPLQQQPSPDGEPKYYLLQTPWKHVPMSSIQAARANAWLAPPRRAEGLAKIRELLSPQQLALHQRISAAPGQAWPVVVDQDLQTAFDAARQVPKK